jgi:hypothetical protein
MTNRDRVKLLFGPYRAPAPKRGDRAACLFRDCTVVITGWSSAPVSWPRCRALDLPGGWRRRSCHVHGARPLSKRNGKGTKEELRTGILLDVLRPIPARKLADSE